MQACVHRFSFPGTARALQRGSVPGAPPATGWNPGCPHPRQHWTPQAPLQHSFEGGGASTWHSLSTYCVQGTEACEFVSSPQWLVKLALSLPPCLTLREPELYQQKPLVPGHTGVQPGHLILRLISPASGKGRRCYLVSGLPCCPQALPDPTSEGTLAPAAPQAPASLLQHQSRVRGQAWPWEGIPKIHIFATLTRRAEHRGSGNHHV